MWFTCRRCGKGCLEEGHGEGWRETIVPSTRRDWQAGCRTSYISTIRQAHLIAATGVPGSSQSNPELEKFFRQNVGLSQDQTACGEGPAVPDVGRDVLVRSDLHTCCS